MREEANVSVWEVAQVAIAGDRQEEFATAVRMNLDIFKDAEGCLDVRLSRVVDRDDLMLLEVQWETLEHHTERFVKSDAFNRFAQMARAYFIAPPVVFHTAVVVDGI
jgi:heme-degrading monooxygenase HmoA